MEDQQRTVLVRCSGHDRPGITTGLLGVLADSGAELFDMEQVVVRDRLTLDLLIGLDAGDEALKELLFHGWEHDLQLDFEVVEASGARPSASRSVVTVIGQVLTPAALRDLTGAITAAGANIDRIVRLSRYPVVSYEFVALDGDVDRMRAELVAAAKTHAVDVAVQRESLERRAKRLVVMDVDSTLIQDEVIELLAREAGCGDEVERITASAMAGDLDFETSLRERTARLAGTPVATLDRVADEVRLTPGARTFVRTLKRLGYTVAIVSGGFSHVTDRLAADLGIDHTAANELEIVDGVVTGRILGEVIDRAGKARVLRETAAAEDIPLEQTVAIGDGANDLDMLATAGLGIAFNAKPVVREAADTAVSVPYLDAILFLLGIRREDIEQADADDPAMAGDGPGPTGEAPPGSGRGPVGAGGRGGRPR